MIVASCPRYLRHTFLPYYSKTSGCPIIRCQLKGVRGERFYRLVVCNQRDPRDGKFIEVIGSYAPDVRAQVKDIRLRFSRVKFWIGAGAKLSRPAADVIALAGLAPPRPPKLGHQRTESSLDDAVRQHHALAVDFLHKFGPRARSGIGFGLVVK